MTLWWKSGVARRLARLTASPRLAPLRTAQSSALVRDGGDLVSALGDVQPMSLNNYPLLMQAASRWGHHTALECGVTGKKYSYSQLQDLSGRCGGVLQGLGAGRGAVVPLLMVNSPDMALVFVGVLASGATPSPVNPSFTPGEVARQVVDSGAKVMISDVMFADTAQAALALVPPQARPTLLLVGGTEGGHPDLLERVQDKNTPFATEPQIEDDDACVLMYSSGTTGSPKGVPTRHVSIRSNLPAVLHPKIFPYQPTTKESQETVMGLMPFFHAWGIYTVLNVSLLKGAKVVTLPSFMPELFLNVITQHKIGVLHVVPPLLQFLAVHPSVTSAALASLRVVMCAAAPCPAALAQALKEKAPNPVFFQEAYGMTETMPTHFTPLGQERLGSCGQLLPGVRGRVVDLDSLSPLPPNTPGEMWVKTPGVMAGYLNNPEATRETISEDGWLKTGDVMTYDEDGFFYVVDRIKELIKVKGSQVSPSELEGELAKLEGVAEAGVVGVKDERAGEVPRAYVVRRDPSLTEEQVVAFLAGRVAPYKQLAGGVVFLDQLPKNQTGKLLRRVLKDMANQ